jgi:hypothetical protein
MGMMLPSTEIIEPTRGPYRTRMQARELLEELRAAYQSLNFTERNLMKGCIRQLERAQAMQELD